MSKEIDILAKFILMHIDGEPSQSEGAGTTAIRIIKKLQAKNKQLKELCHELVGDPEIDYDKQTENLQTENKRLREALNKNTAFTQSQAQDPSLWLPNESPSPKEFAYLQFALRGCREFIGSVSEEALDTVAPSQEVPRECDD